MSTDDETTVLDALPDGVVVADRDGVVRAVNAVACHLLGTERESALGGRLSDVLDLLDAEGRSWCSANDPYGGISTRRGVPEQAWQASSGDEVLVTASLVRPDPTRPVEQVVVAIRSGRGRARLDRDRSDLVATVAHELRSPLSGVKGFAHALLLRWERLNDEQRQLMVRTIHADADRLSRLITDLLDVARLDTGRLRLVPRSCDLVVLAQRATESVAVGTARRITLTSEPGLPAADVDPDRFTQVVTNLLENAVIHGSGEVSVTLSAPEGIDGHVLLTVEDEGDGIPEGTRRRVVTKFWTSGSGGSGLGLFIAHGLAVAHGGSLEISDSPAGGARIETRWPRAAEPMVGSGASPAEPTP